MKKIRALYTLVLLLFVFSTLITTSAAWFATFITAETDGEFEGSAIISYFAGGEGTKEKPYIILNDHHLYNLAWLQNSGSFEDKVYYFQISDKNGNPIDALEMAGGISGDDDESGAIPPIGTSTHPFKGYFNGMGATISNVWVSTVKDDWKEQPDGASEYTDKYVGLFGYVGQGAIIEDFVLDKIEVKSHITDATVGIVCGYVGGMVYNVGVYNGIVNLTAGSTAQSKYTLIGEKSDDITWVDMPTIDSEYGEGGGESGGDGSGGESSGGAIKIDVNDGVLTTKFVGEENGKLGTNYIQVPGALEDRAFIVGSDVSYSSPGIKSTYYIYTANINSRTSVGKTFGTNCDVGSSLGSVGANNFEQINTNTYVEGNATLASYGIEINEHFATRMAEGGGTVLKTNATAPKQDALTEVTLSTGEKVYLPTNSVWFKPKKPGKCVIAFSVGKMNDNKHRSIYRIHRDEDGNIDDWQETTFTFLKAPKFKNSEVVVFQYEIDAQDAAEHYEFAVGASTGENDDSVYFYFLALAGASETDGDDEGGGEGSGGDGEIVDGVYSSVMFDIDYVVSPDTDVSAEDYVNHQTLLKFEKVQTANDTKLYFLAAGTQETPTVGYYAPTGVTVTDISVEKQSTAINSPTAQLPGGVYFNDRKTKPS